MDIVVKDNSIVLSDEVQKILEEYQETELLLKEKQLKLDEVKEAIREAMKQNGIKSFENDFVRIEYKAESTRKSVDTESLKQDGLYDLYTKTSKVKDSVRITYLNE